MQIAYTLNYLNSFFVISLRWGTKSHGYNKGHHWKDCEGPTTSLCGLIGGFKNLINTLNGIRCGIAHLRFKPFHTDGCQCLFKKKNHLLLNHYCDIYVIFFVSKSKISHYLNCVKLLGNRGDCFQITKVQFKWTKHTANVNHLERTVSVCPFSYTPAGGSMTQVAQLSDLQISTRRSLVSIEVLVSC